MTSMTTGHIVKRFDGELAQLHQLVLDTGILVRDQLHRAVKTLEDEDPKAAREVIDRDKEVNALDIRADEEMIRILAKRQPLARDLREVITISKAMGDLERVGDEARKIARLTIHVYDNDGSPPNGQILRDIHTMAAYVDSMLKMCLESFDELDLQKALDVLQMDVELDNEFKSCIRRLATFIMEDSRSVGHVIDVVLGIRALERIGGHAKNIAGYVVFLATGKDVRHESLDAVKRELTVDS
ncbi:MAG: phosphate signaling complex protein PhoU [Gammaproteobacteria bacterium]